MKTVIECPDGRLLNPGNLLPMITKLLFSNASAGLGIAKMFFSTLENIAETSEADSNDSQIFVA